MMEAMNLAAHLGCLAALGLMALAACRNYPPSSMDHTPAGDTSRPVASIAAASVSSATAKPSFVAVALSADHGSIGFDDLVFASRLRRVLVPAGRTGKVD